MILEDASADAILIGEGQSEARSHLQRIRKAAADVVILTDAAVVALDHSRAGRR
jgi:hypothetical protein